MHLCNIRESPLFIKYIYTNTPFFTAIAAENFLLSKSPPPININPAIAAFFMPKYE